MSNTCPKCGSAINPTMTALNVWMCGTSQVHDMAINESTLCLHKQLAAKSAECEVLIGEWQEKLVVAEEAASDAWMHRELADKDLHEHACNLIRKFLLDLDALLNQTEKPC
jgi:hypothetical protein